jgi:hypothetical protein
MAKQPATHVGTSKPDMKTGNKVAPTTKAKPAPNAVPGSNKKKK